MSFDSASGKNQSHQKILNSDQNLAQNTCFMLPASNELSLVVRFGIPRAEAAGSFPFRDGQLRIPAGFASIK